MKYLLLIAVMTMSFSSSVYAKGGSHKHSTVSKPKSDKNDSKNPFKAILNQ